MLSVCLSVSACVCVCVCVCCSQVQALTCADTEPDGMCGYSCQFPWVPTGSYIRCAQGSEWESASLDSARCTFYSNSPLMFAAEILSTTLAVISVAMVVCSRRRRRMTRRTITVIAGASGFVCVGVIAVAMLLTTASHHWLHAIEQAGPIQGVSFCSAIGMQTNELLLNDYASDSNGVRVLSIAGRGPVLVGAS